MVIQLMRRTCKALDCAGRGDRPEPHQARQGEHVHGHTGDHACCSHDHGADVSTQARVGGRTFKVSGLDCAEEVAVLKREIGPLVGGEDRLAFDVLNGRMTVAEDARHVPDRDITAAVKRTGMSASRWEPGRDDGWRRRAPAPPAGLVDRPQRSLGADWPRAAHLACGRVRGSAAAARAPRTGHAAARDRRLRVRDRLRRPLRAGEGVVRRPAPATRHQPPDGDRGRGRDRHRRMVRGRDGRFSVRLVAHARELEHRQGTPRDLGAARPDAADRARPVGHRRGAGDRGGGKRRSARASSSGRASASRSTAASSSGRARSTRRRSPARACRSPRSRAARCSPAPSTATARSRSRAPRRPKTPRSPASRAWSRERTAGAPGPSSGSRSSPACTRRR